MQFRKTTLCPDGNCPAIYDGTVRVRGYTVDPSEVQFDQPEAEPAASNLSMVEIPKELLLKWLGMSGGGGGGG